MPSERLSPAEEHVRSIISGVVEVGTESGGGLSVNAIMTLLGHHSHTLVILVLSVLNMIPGPPGYGGTLAFAMIFMAVTMVLGVPVQLPGWIGDRQIPSRFLMRMLDRLGTFARVFARFSRPRLEILTGDSARRPMAAFVILVSLPMVLPIPFINAVPNVGIAVMTVSRINRDGLGVILGFIIACLGLVIAVAAVWGAISLVQLLIAM